MSRANFSEVFTIGMHNAVTDDGIVKDIPTQVTFVHEESELTSIDANPGDFAATYGMGSIWQYDGSTWQEVGA